MPSCFLPKESIRPNSVASIRHRTKVLHEQWVFRSQIDPQFGGDVHQHHMALGDLGGKAVLIEGNPGDGLGFVRGGGTDRPWRNPGHRAGTIGRLAHFDPAGLGPGFAAVDFVDSSAGLFFVRLFSDVPSFFPGLFYRFYFF